MLQKIGQLFGVGVVAGVLVAALALPAVGGIGITARNIATGFLNMPSELETPPPPQRSTIYDQNGEVIAEIFDQNRELVELDDMAPVMQDAIIAIEDNRFHEHGGLDIPGTFRAALRTAGGDTQGGSSLTQQYVKNVLIESATTQAEQEEARETTLSRKIRELRYAIALEQKMSKDEILEGYLNIAYFGDGAYGAQSAAQHFFGVDADELELEQAALLAGLVRYPYLYNPSMNPDDAQKRRDVVLDAMVHNDAISKKEAEKAKKKDIDLDVSNPSNGCMPSDQPFFCDYVVQEIEKDERYGENETERARWLRTAGLKIHTTLDVDMQGAAQDAVDKWVPRKNKSRKVGAEVLVEPGTGEIRAMAQSRNYGPDEENLGETSINFTTGADRGGSTGFQVGSTFKPIALAAALDQGKGFGTSYGGGGSTTVTGQRNCDGGRLPPWPVSNASESDGGSYTMVSGTKQSANTYFAQLQADVGLCETIEMAQTLGLKRGDGTSFDNENTQANNSFVLGSEEVALIDLVSAYATFASGGIYCEPQAITSIDDQQSGETLEVDKECERVISKDVANGVTHLLSNTFDGGTTDGLEIGRPASAKTGTTDGNAAASFSGYTPNLAGSVWVGDPRGPQAHPLRGVTLGGKSYGVVFGATIPGPIWKETMTEAVKNLPKESLPKAPSTFGGSGGSSSRNASPANSDSGIPNVVGQDEDTAVSELEDAGFQVSVSSAPIRSEEPEGTVAAVNPDPGSTLPEGATVNVFLSGGDGS